MSCFDLAAFKNLVLSLAFDIFTIICRGVDLFEFILLGVFLSFLDMHIHAFFRLEIFFSHFIFKYFPASFSLSYPSQTPIMHMLVCLMVSFRSLKFCSFLLILFSFCPSDLEKAMATHSTTLAWKIPWTGEPGRLQSMGSLGVRHD